VNLSPASVAMLEAAQVMPFRLRPGDEASCLNLYQPRMPRILGAPDAMIDRGGFTFKSTLAQTDDEKRNPWMLLDRQLPDRVIPAIGDYNTVMWLMHLGLEQELAITDERGAEARLCIVAMLSGSVLQGELIVAESHFVELFPSIGGYGFFLIDAPPEVTLGLSPGLESDLSDYGLDVVSTADRLDRYMAVENTYLSTFQTLGGLGVVLGTFGLGAVLWRNVLERRGELALMRALGYRRMALGLMVLAENSALLLSGLAAGVVSAMLAVAPHALSSPAGIPWTSLALTLVAVALVGTLAGIVAIVPALSSPLLPALRKE